jgi:hypothetical protein
MDKSTIALAIVMLTLGIFIGTLIPDIRTASSTTALDIPSPGNWIDKSDIDVYDDRVVINIEGAVKAGVKDTNSMDPLIDKDSELIEIKPDISQIHAGDIISFEMGGMIVVHEVVETGYDSEGWYAITKGINNKQIDPGLRREPQIKGVVIGIFN